jgi:hypothetical protein
MHYPVRFENVKMCFYGPPSDAFPRTWMQAAQRIRYSLLEAECAAREEYHTTLLAETTGALQAEIDSIQEQYALLVRLNLYPSYPACALNCRFVYASKSITEPGMHL